MEYVNKKAIIEMLENSHLISDGEYCGYYTDDIDINKIPSLNFSSVYDLLELICDIAVDHDGFNTIESLKELIDEMAGYASDAMNILASVNEGEKHV